MSESLKTEKLNKVSYLVMVKQVFKTPSFSLVDTLEKFREELVSSLCFERKVKVQQEEENAELLRRVI